MLSYSIYLSLPDTSLSLRPSKSPHVVANSILFYGYYSTVCVCTCVCIVYIYNKYTFIFWWTTSSVHLLMDTGCFHTLAIVNNAAVNIGVHPSFQISGFGKYVTDISIQLLNGWDDIFKEHIYIIIIRIKIDKYFFGFLCWRFLSEIFLNSDIISLFCLLGSHY